MRNTRSNSGKVAVGTDGNAPKKKGKQPPTSSGGKRKVTSTSQPASVDGAANVGATTASNTALQIIQNYTKAAPVAAVAVASIENANNANSANKPDDVIESPPRRGKKQMKVSRCAQLAKEGKRNVKGKGCKRKCPHLARGEVNKAGKAKGPKS